MVSSVAPDTINVPAGARANLLDTLIWITTLRIVVTESLTERIADINRQLAILPEAEEPPSTFLQILGRSHKEQDWQRLLFYFLDPDESHGFEHAVLEHVLRAFSDRADLDYTYSRFDLDDIKIEQEVITESGRPDGVLWAGNDWFICFELKVTASEGEDQTQRYVDDRVFDSIGLRKSDVPIEGHNYVYLAPRDASQAEADEFVHISWEWVASELQTFLSQSHGEHPVRSTAQLDDFIDTVRNELTMTEYQENQREKVKLFIDNYDEISSLIEAFENEWKEFQYTWGDRLAQTLETAEMVVDTVVPEEYVPLDIEMENGDVKRWTFRQGKEDWSWMFPEDWWTKLDEQKPIYDTPKPNARVGFLHRLDDDRDRTLENHVLKFYLRNAPSGHDDFYNNFADRFNRDDDIPRMLPSETERPGVKSNVLEAEYDINTDLYDDFFEAYIDALARAIDDHVVSNSSLVYRIDSHYEDTIREDTPF